MLFLTAVLALAACTNDASHERAGTAPTSATDQVEASSAPTAEASASVTPPTEQKPIASTRGDKGIVGEVYRVQRKDGVLTVWAGAKNTGAASYLPVNWRNGNDPYTLAGSSVVDSKNSKRYMALLDSSGKCLCSEKLGDAIEPGETRPLYVQFQAPPQDVTEGDLQLGNMQVVTIAIPGV
ncbi:hypothetical protein ABT160_42790 [Streptomyces sp. NPDC001941]|uniref:hypothetical protein n=1 Tax=Streptomyces sp. NPDC001941 TaxID=3154659 RepID=UPI0033303AD8